MVPLGTGLRANRTSALDASKGNFNLFGTVRGVLAAVVNTAQGTETFLPTKKVIIVIVVAKAMAANDLMIGG